METCKHQPIEFAKSERVDGFFSQYTDLSPSQRPFRSSSLITAMIVGQSHSVSAASRGELWFVVHDLCLPAYRSAGTAHVDPRLGRWARQGIPVTDQLIDACRIDIRDFGQRGRRKWCASMLADQTGNVIPHPAFKNGDGFVFHRRKTQEPTG
jgi:hypothetical protein